MIDPVVVGLYGISGVGKSHALGIIQETRPEWRCVEGSRIMEQVLEEGGQTMEDFRKMNTIEKDKVRVSATQKIKAFRGVTVVAGHCSFPSSSLPGGDQRFTSVFTSVDASTFQAIFCLEKTPETILSQREQDNSSGKRTRRGLSDGELAEWQRFEEATLKTNCGHHGILFRKIKEQDDVLGKLVHYVDDRILAQDAPRRSMQSLLVAVEAIPSADVYLLIDGDRTLCPQDTGKMFMAHVGTRHDSSLTSIFKRSGSYTFGSFLNAALLYNTLLPEEKYLALCEEIGKSQVNIYHQWIDVLTLLPSGVHAVVISSGLREVWHHALERSMPRNQSNVPDGTSTAKVSIIAGNHIALHPYVVDSEAKAMVVKELRRLHGGCRILSFGDSVVDSPMLEESDRGYVVIDDRNNRSMKEFIQQQVSSGRSIQRLFQICLDDRMVLDFVRKGHYGLQTTSLSTLTEEIKGGNLHTTLDCSASSATARFFATQTRRADFSGPSLQQVHVDVGRLLAQRLLDEHTTHFVRDKSFPHVQGSTFEGMETHNKIMIVPLMRGGEPMSRGVHQWFPNAKLVHFDDNRDFAASVESCVANDATEIVIVDSVINEGNSVRRAIHSVLASFPRATSSTLRLYIVAAVMQSKAANLLPKEFPRARFVTLRISQNQYKGQGGTDTGNRLFGTIDDNSSV